tara:strand:+ start:496 stop:723 length:228 start_codon:yes stop_codon:yes gene_type:complete
MCIRKQTANKRASCISELATIISEVAYLRVKVKNLKGLNQYEKLLLKDKLRVAENHYWLCFHKTKVELVYDDIPF